MLKSLFRKMFYPENGFALDATLLSGTPYILFSRCKPVPRVSAPLRVTNLVSGNSDSSRLARQTEIAKSRGLEPLIWRSYPPHRQGFACGGSPSEV
jgi:hypothetical protein